MHQPRIHVAFRFHVNFYHSYRGDTPDELGFGQDIRVIRHILKVLRRFNADGVPLRATWDIENAFSLGDIMPEHCPDIIEGLQERVRTGMDEIEVMSYNNGLISAHTAAEFDAAIGRALTNDEGSGLRDVFGRVEPIVRPQEMMMTPAHLTLYRHHGISAISLFYSAVPFNAFSVFVPPLPFSQRYNPLTLTHPDVGETLTLVPARNHGDIADHLSLKRWVKQLRRRQLALDAPTDLLLLIDHDADDKFWEGYDWPIVRDLLPVAQGLEALVTSIADLDFVTFTTPGRYLQTHEPIGTVTIDQDTADGSFDGMASWAEKWSNHQLWTGIERARIMELQARRLARDDDLAALAGHLSQGFDARLRALSTTHFGLSAPVMNTHRLQGAARLVHTAVDAARQALRLATAHREADDIEQEGAIAFSIVDYVRGVNTQAVTYLPKRSKQLVRIPLRLPMGMSATLNDASGHPLPSALSWDIPPHPSSAQEPQAVELCFVTDVDGGECRTYRLSLGTDRTSPAPDDPVAISEKGNRLYNSRLSLRFDADGHPISLALAGEEYAVQPFLRSAIRYGLRELSIDKWRTTVAEVRGRGLLGVITARGSVRLSRGEALRVTRTYEMAAGLPYLYVTTTVAYPRTAPDISSGELVRRLGRPFDARWQEIMPCEIRPALSSAPRQALRIWKHNYLDHVTSYDLDYGQYSRNQTLDAFNNHVTHAWVAATDQTKGLLVAQDANAATCFAFCPMRTIDAGGDTRLRMNPFGTYSGDQLHYPIADTGLGRWLAVRMAETLRSLAPSYNGRGETFRLMLAPYLGDAPPPALQADAEAFTYPYAVVSSSPLVLDPGHRAWSGAFADGDPVDGSASAAL